MQHCGNSWSGYIIRSLDKDEIIKRLANLGEQLKFPNDLEQITVFIKDAKTNDIYILDIDYQPILLWSKVDNRLKVADLSSISENLLDTIKCSRFVEKFIQTYFKDISYTQMNLINFLLGDLPQFKPILKDYFSLVMYLLYYINTYNLKELVTTPKLNKLEIYLLYELNKNRSVPIEFRKAIFVLIQEDVPLKIAKFYLDEVFITKEDFNSLKAYAPIFSKVVQTYLTNNYLNINLKDNFHLKSTRQRILKDSYYQEYYKK